MQQIIAVGRIGKSLAKRKIMRNGKVIILSLGYVAKANGVIEFNKMKQ
jgi:hypothetical protein